MTQATLMRSMGWHHIPLSRSKKPKLDMSSGLGPRKHLRGIGVVPELLQTKCRAQANLQKIVHKDRGCDTYIICFTSIGRESLPFAETDVATLKNCIKLVFFEGRSPMQVKADDGSDNTVPHWL